MIKLFCSLFFLTISVATIAQIADDFSDGDFTSMVSWSGDTDKFIVDTERLRSNYTPLTNTVYYLSTEIDIVYDAVWEWYVELDFATSGVNYVDIFLVSDSHDLTLTQNGYFIRIGDTADEVVLYKRTAGIDISLIDDDIRRVDGTSNNIFKIRVSRSISDVFTLEIDDGNVGSFVSVGTQTDSDHTASVAFGILIAQSTAGSPVNNHYFDDVSITGSMYPDLVAPYVDSYTIQSANQILVDFSETVSISSAETIANYSITPSITLSMAERQSTDSSQALLTLADNLTNGSAYNITIQNVEDLSGNSLTTSYVSDFTYIVFDSPFFRSVVINELNPAPGNSALPNAEYVELYNSSADSYYQLENWTLEDASGGTATLPKDTLKPGTYLLLTSDTSLFDMAASKLPISIPSLNNSGDVIYLKDASDQLIDSLVYSASSVNSIEQINPTIDFFYNENYDYSTDAKGGTPGIVNAIFDETPDTTPPSIVTTELIGDESLRLTFDEQLEKIQAETTSNYLLVNQNAFPDQVTLSSSGKSAILFFSAGFASAMEEEVVVNGVEDLFANSLDTSVYFTYYLIEAAIEGDVLVNEFLVSPNEYEFVELFNVSGKYIDLDGWIIEDASGNQLNLSSFRLDPASLVVITSSSGTDSLGVGGFPLLNNSTDIIVLRNEEGFVIDSIGYDAFEDGFSYELINPTLPCKGFYNYGLSATTHSAGIVNSLFTDAADEVPPHIESIEVISDDSLWIVFDEPLDPTFDLSTAFNFNSVSVDQVQSDGALSYWVLLDSSLTSEIYESVTLAGVTDCSGNVLADTSWALYIDQKPPVLEGVILWSDHELLLYFDELLESITSSDKSKFQIDGQNVTGLDMVDSLKATLLLTIDSTFDNDIEYTLSVEGLSDTTRNAIGLWEEVFTVSSAVRSVFIPAANILDVNFESSLDSISASQPTHYWIKAIGNPTLATWNSSSPDRVRLHFDESVPDNKSLLLYMLGIYDEDSSHLPTPAISFIYDTDPPELIESEVPTDSTILLTFDEAIDPGSAINPTHYSLDGEQVFESLMIAPDRLRLTPTTNLQEEISYELTYDELRDLNGNQMSKAKSVTIVYDKQVPEIDSVYQSGLAQMTIVASEQLLEGSLALDHFWYHAEMKVFPIGYTLDGEKIELDFADSIPQVTDLDIFITSWTDLFENELSDTLQVTLDIQHPRVVSLQPSSETSLRIRFNQTLSTSNTEPANYLVGDDPATVVVITEEFVEVSFQDPFVEGDTLQLSFIDIVNSTGKPLVDTLKSFVFDPYIAGVEVLDSMKLYVEFDHPIYKDQLINFTIEGGSPDLQTVTIDDPTQVVLVPQTPLDVNVSYLIEWAPMQSTSGPLIPAYHQSVLFDRESPKLISIQNDYLGKIVATFSEPLSDASLEQVSNYQISGIGLPISTEVLSNEIIELVFPGLIIGQSYKLVYYNATDLSGNRTSLGTFSFDYVPPVLPLAGEIVINEFMPDPTPSVGLPEREYIELWNVSDQSFNLRGLVLSDRSKTVNLPDYVLDAGNWVALATDSENGLFLETESLPSLDNSGDSVTISTVRGDVLDIVVYDEEWFRDEEKSAGGYSLELINPIAVCKGPANWQGSASETGGTPGFENSVYRIEPDQDAPYLVDFDVITPDAIQLRFSEWMDTTRMDTSSLIFPAEISYVHYDERQICTVGMRTPLLPGHLETFMIGGFYDCSGNVILDTTVVTGRPISPITGDLMITELMADPSPVVGLTETEYIELYNLTDSLISLENVSINDVTLSGIIYPRSYIVLVPANETGLSLAINSIAVSPWISLSNSGEDLVIKNENTELAYLHYSKTWHEVDKQDGGYSLEAIDPNLYCDQQSNWRSSQSVSGGTPGYQNSVFAVKGDDSSPLITHAEILDSMTVSISFNEFTAFELTDWSISPSLAIEKVVYDTLDRLSVEVQIIEQLLFNEHYTFTVVNASDCYGNVSPDLSVQVLRPERSIDELFINEILFDPKTGGQDMVELVNTSGTRYIDLQYLEWYSGSTIRSISDSYLLLAPNSYLALTEDKAQLIFDYPQSDVDHVFELDQVPGLANAEGYLVIQDRNGQVLDSVYYLDDFHSPLLGDPEGVSLERLSLDYPAIDQDNWASASSTSGFATPGFKNSQQASQSQVEDRLAINPRTFVPGSANPARPSFTTINYEMPVSGMIANIHIYDVNGRVIKTIGEGIILGAEGFLTWDGSTDRGGVARIGQYVLVMELYNSNVDRQYIRKPVTIGAEF
jgi:hypothetical protein